MNARKAAVTTLAFSVLSVSGLQPACFGAAFGQAQTAGQSTGQTAAVRRIGAIKAINGNVITLAPDSGPVVSVTVPPNARIVRIPPGEKNLKNATPIQFPELQVGDRILVGGKGSDDAKSIEASSIVAMKLSDVEARHDQEREDWQKRGLGGLVGAVDPAAGTITISVTSLGAKKNITVQTSKNTLFRRYAPDSVKFDDAKPSTLQEIHPGDQLRARGERSPDGSELTAEEIVTGSFHNVAGLVNSVDASGGTITVQDLLSKKPVQVKVTAESQLHKLPPDMAQRIAMRLKGTMASGTGAAAASGSGAAPAAGNAVQPGAPSGGMNAGGGATSAGGMRQGGTFDFQQMLSRMPAVTLADLHKGDAVLIVTTEGTATEGGTAITLLSGVEPILQAAPNGSQAMMLAPWSLGGAPAGDASP